MKEKYEKPKLYDDSIQLNQLNAGCTNQGATPEGACGGCDAIESAVCDGVCTAEITSQ
jgi:hypothetical protein